MKNESHIIQKAFQPWKIYSAIVLGIAIIGWMLYHNLSQPYFVYDPGNGTHEWVSSSSDEVVNPTEVDSFVISPNGDYRQQQLVDLIAAMNWTSTSAFWLFMAVVFMIARDLFYMLRIKILTKNELNWKQSFNVIMLWEFASALSPGVVGGAAVAMFILRKEKIQLGRSTAIVMITALMDNLFFLLMVPIVLFFFNAHGELIQGLMVGSSIQWMFWLGYLGIFLLSLMLLIGIFVYPQMIKRLLQFIFKLPFLRKWRDRAEKTGNEIVLTSSILKHENFYFWLTASMSTFFSWISRYFVINCLIAAFVALSMSDHWLVLGKQFVLWIVMLVSPTPGGSGIAEFAFGKIMAGMGVSALLLTAIAALWRLISYFPYLIIGTVILPRWMRRK